MNLIKRIIVALIFIPLILLTFYLGSIYLLSLLAVISILMSYEFINIMKMKDVRFSYLNIIFPPMILLSMSYKKYDYVLLILFIQILSSGFGIISSGKLKNSILKISSSIFISLYSGIFLSLVYLIRTMQNGKYLILLLIILIWITDSGAYFVGMSVGKHRGFIKASPKKSIEGFVGGFVFAIIFAVIFTYVFPIGFIPAIFASISAGIFGQFGDLVESLIKRDAEIKDSSHIIPGHGGILDRFDSLLIAAPAFYLLLIFLR